MKCKNARVARRSHLEGDGGLGEEGKIQGLHRNARHYSERDVVAEAGDLLEEHHAVGAPGAGNASRQVPVAHIADTVMLVEGGQQDGAVPRHADSQQQQNHARRPAQGRKSKRKVGVGRRSGDGGGQMVPRKGPGSCGIPQCPDIGRQGRRK